MTPSERSACLAALQAAEQAAEALRTILGTDGAAPHRANASPGDDLVPLAVACSTWGISEEAARKRAQRGAGRKIGQRWFVLKSAL